ncbi:MAG TPA: hypothetical protein VMV94_12585 [Phycisphaerae bacterium]|nr:hypothetical protein [Phycisphaerae bacterium]
MSADEIREILEREPFQAFRVRLTSGSVYAIHSPHSAVAMKNRLFAAAPNSDRWTLIPYLHIAVVESIGNGHARRAPRRGR